MHNKKSTKKKWTQKDKPCTGRPCARKTEDDEHDSNRTEKTNPYPYLTTIAEGRGNTKLHVHGSLARELERILDEMNVTYSATEETVAEMLKKWAARKSTNKADDARKSHIGNRTFNDMLK